MLYMCMCATWIATPITMSAYVHIIIFMVFWRLGDNFWVQILLLRQWLEATMVTMISGVLVVGNSCYKSGETIKTEGYLQGCL